MKKITLSLIVTALVLVSPAAIFGSVRDVKLAIDKVIGEDKIELKVKFKGDRPLKGSKPFDVTFFDENGPIKGHINFTTEKGHNVATVKAPKPGQGEHKFRVYVSDADKSKAEGRLTAKFERHQA